MSLYQSGYEQLGFLELSLQDDGTFGMDPANLTQMDSAALNLNVFDDQGLGEAGLHGFDPDMQDASAPPKPREVVVGEQTEILAVELTPRTKTTVAILGGLAIGLLIAAALDRD